MVKHARSRYDISVQTRPTLRTGTVCVETQKGGRSDNSHNAMMSALKPPSLLQRFRKGIVDCDCSYFLANAFGDCSSLGLASASLRMESPRMRRDVAHHQIMMEKGETGEKAEDVNRTNFLAPWHRHFKELSIKKVIARHMAKELIVFEVRFWNPQLFPESQGQVRMYVSVMT